MTRRFAETTRVPVERSKAEIEHVLTRYGADQFISGWEHGRAMLGFRVHNRMVRFELPLPDSDGKHSPRRDQEVRQRWRALLLVIKAKLEAVHSQIATFESEFLAHIVLPNNRTVGQEFIPQLAQIYKTGKMPKLLGDGASGERIAAPWCGVGQDGGDKGVYKAMTGGEKYFLLKTFLIPTGDDPEAAGPQKPQRSRGAAAPPEKVLDASTGEEVPASAKPAPPEGYRYIDAYKVDGGWHELQFHHMPTQGLTLTLSTKIERVGAVAAQAFQSGVPVKVGWVLKKGEKRAGYLNTIETWKPEAPAPPAVPVTASEIPF